MGQDNRDKEGDLGSVFEDSPRGFREIGGEKPISHVYDTDTPKVIRWVLKRFGGYVKDERQAYYAIVVFIGIAVIVSLFLLLSGDVEIEEKNIFNPETAPPDIDDMPAR